MILKALSGNLDCHRLSSFLIAAQANLVLTLISLAKFDRYAPRYLKPSTCLISYHLTALVEFRGPWVLKTMTSACFSLNLQLPQAWLEIPVHP